MLVQTRNLVPVQVYMLAVSRQPFLLFSSPGIKIAALYTKDCYPVLQFSTKIMLFFLKKILPCSNTISMLCQLLGCGVANLDLDDPLSLGSQKFSFMV